MHLLFLIPLTVSIVAVYVSKNSTAEMAELTGLITFIGIILGLILAPWQLQLLVLMLVVIGTRRLLLQNQSRVELEKNKFL
jgi:hypothetical protein